MKTEELSFRHKKEAHNISVVIPDDLAEAVKILGREATMEALVIGLRIQARQNFLGLTKRKRKHLHLKLQELTEDQLGALKSAGLLK